MFKYSWQQHYALDRFDLEGPMGSLVGWITGFPNMSITHLVHRDGLGYIASYSIDPKQEEEVSWSWKIWWAERDENGYYKPDSITDGATYSKMNDAKSALQERFGIKSDEVITVKWAGNTIKYN